MPNFASKSRVRRLVRFAHAENLVVRCEIRAPFSQRVHKHPYYKLIFFPNDACEADLSYMGFDGALKTDSLRGRHVLFVAKNALYALNWKNTTTIGSVCFGERFLCEEAQVAQWKDVFHRTEWELAERELAIYQLMVIYDRLCQRRERLYFQYTQSVSRVLATLVLRSNEVGSLVLDEGTPGPPSLTTIQVRQVHDYIMANLGETIRVKEMASMAGFCPDHFTRLFKAATGKTPREYIMMRRLGYAQHLINERRQGHNNLRMADIAAEAGFCDQSHFDGCLRRFLRETEGKVGFWGKKVEKIQLE